MASLCSIGDQPVDVVRAFNEAINAGDLTALSGLMDDAHRFIDSAGSVTTGKAACRAAWVGFFETFPDYRNEFEVVDDLGDGRVVATGRSSCSVDALDGPAIWTALVVDGRVQEWAVNEPT